MKQALLPLILALLFTLALTFASVELPYVVDRALQELIITPRDDSHASSAQVYRTELFITHFHLRLLGYLCFGATILLVIVGFATRKSGIAALGALAFMLPVFAQFASVMFFLAGLGLLNVFWMPVLDLAAGFQKLGLIMRAPYDILMWLFRQIGINAYWPIVYSCIGGGLLVFFLGTFAWLSGRARGTKFADFHVYRFSRHPQYLGWMLWSYGLYLLLLRGMYPRRSWGFDASLPFLVSTLVIIGIAMLEEIAMQHRFGDAYSVYHARTPFLFPVPRFLSRGFRAPFRLFFHKPWPDRPREIGLVIALSLVILMGLSFLVYGGGLEQVFGLVRGEEARRVKMEATAFAFRGAPDWRSRRAEADRLASFGEQAVPYFIEFLKDEDPGIRADAVEQLGKLGIQSAVPELIRSLRDSHNEVRYRSIQALSKLDAREAADSLLALAGHRDRITRRIACRALAEIHEERAAESLVGQLRDSLDWVRVAAAEDLGTLGSPKGVPGLVECLHHRDPALRRAAVVSLTRIGCAEALGPLREAQSDEDWEVRVYAVEGVKVLASPRARSRETLPDPSGTTP